jgi:hypothetical protein
VITDVTLGAGPAGAQASPLGRRIF